VQQQPWTRSASRSRGNQQISFVLATRELKREIIRSLITSLLAESGDRHFLTIKRAQDRLSRYPSIRVYSFINPERRFSSMKRYERRSTVFSFAMQRIESLPGIARYGYGNDSRYRFSRFFPPVRSVCRAYTVVYATARG